MTLRSDWNTAYYGQPYSGRQIVEQMLAANRGADPLREVLTRFGTPRTMPANAPPPPPPYAGQPPAQGGPGYPQADQSYGGMSQGQGGQPIQLQPGAAGAAAVAAAAIALGRAAGQSGEAKQGQGLCPWNPTRGRCPLDSRQGQSPWNPSLGVV